ncbi:hypothetical protein JCM15519_24130 [Fundidesulfovibrio butyratiphilus]
MDGGKTPAVRRLERKIWQKGREGRAIAGRCCGRPETGRWDVGCHDIPVAEVAFAGPAESTSLGPLGRPARTETYRASAINEAEPNASTRPKRTRGHTGELGGKKPLGSVGIAARTAAIRTESVHP